MFYTFLPTKERQQPLRIKITRSVFIASDIVVQKLFKKALVIHIRWYCIIGKINTQARKIYRNAQNKFCNHLLKTYIGFN